MSKQPDTAPSSQPANRLLSLLPLLALAGFIYVSSRPQRFGATEALWSFAGIGLLFVVMVVHDLIKGQAYIPWAIASYYTRAEAPSRFWLALLINASLALFFLVGPLGQLMGYWTFLG